MTLLTGTLYLGGTTGQNTRNIRYEITGATGSYALSTAMSAKQTTPKNVMSDFEGYTHYAIPATPTAFALPVYNGTQFSLNWTNNSGSSGPPTQLPQNSEWEWLQHVNVGGGSYTVGATVNWSGSSDTWVRACDNLPYWFRVQHKNNAGDGAFRTTSSSVSAACCLLGGQFLMVEPDIYKKIEDFKKDDFVYTTHEKRPREFSKYKITQFKKSPVTSYFLLLFENNEQIKCSRTHKIMCVGGEKKINDIHPGDSVLQVKNDEIIELKLINKLIINENEYVYNLNVGDAHTYITKDGIIHHNEK